jgi:hypothetical protein
MIVVFFLRLPITDPAGFGSGTLSTSIYTPQETEYVSCVLIPVVRQTFKNYTAK